MDWDEPMSGELLKKWEKLIDGPKMAQPLSFQAVILVESRRKCSHPLCKVSVMHLIEHMQPWYTMYLSVETKKTITMRFLASKTSGTFAKSDHSQVGAAISLAAC